MSKEKTGHSFSAFFKRAVSPLMVLSLLREREMYGYEISQEISQRSGGKLAMSLLYPVLYRLVEQQYVVVSSTIIENGRVRSYYAITDEGRAYYDTTIAEYLELVGQFQHFLDTPEQK